LLAEQLGPGGFRLASFLDGIKLYQNKRVLASKKMHSPSVFLNQF
jgi:hypothetical protein